MRGDWDDVNRRLVGAMLALDLYDALVVAERREPQRRGLFRRPVEPEPRRFVQVTAGQAVLVAECGTGTQVPAELARRLERQGWEPPWQQGETTYQRQAPLTGAPRLAVALVRALQAMGCEVADLEVTLQREEPE